MLSDIRARLLEIVATLTAVTGTIYTPAQNVPPDRQDYEGWVLWIRIPSESAGVTASQDTDTRVSNWTIEITSPQINTGWPAEREIEQMQYADAIRHLFWKYKRLEGVTTRQALHAIRKITLTNITMRAPRPYPDQGVRQYYSVSVSLAIEYMEQIVC